MAKELLKIVILEFGFELFPDLHISMIFSYFT